MILPSRNWCEMKQGAMNRFLTVARFRKASLITTGHYRLLKISSVITVDIIAFRTVLTQGTQPSMNFVMLNRTGSGTF